MSGIGASVLDVEVEYMGQEMNTQINNVNWEGNQFTGTVYGVSVSGIDNNGILSVSGSYLGQSITETATVVGFQ